MNNIETNFENKINKYRLIEKLQSITNNQTTKPDVIVRKVKNSIRPFSAVPYLTTNDKSSKNVNLDLSKMS
jgi:hypothetical protein